MNQEMYHSGDKLAFDCGFRKPHSYFQVASSHILQDKPFQQFFLRS